MSPFGQGETSSEFWIQGVIPLVLGVSGMILGILHICGITCCRCQKREVAPALLNHGNDFVSSSPEDDRRISTYEAERKYGPIACEAKLWGLTKQERRSILENIFSRPDRKQVAEPRRRKDGSSETQHQNCCTLDDGLERGTLDNQYFDNTDHSALDMRFSCAICLREYGTLFGMITC